MKKLILFLAIIAVLAVTGQTGAYAGTSTQGDTFNTVYTAATRTTIYPPNIGGDTIDLKIVQCVITYCGAGDSSVLVKIEDKWSNGVDGDTTSEYRVRFRVKVEKNNPFTWTPTGSFRGLYATTDISDTIGVYLDYK